MSVFLETERLVLREFTDDDVDDLVELDSDPDVLRWTPDEVPSREDVEQRHLPYFRRFYAETPGFGCWAAEEKATGAFLGWFHLRPGDGHPADEPEIGYRLRRSSWGKGYATEGSRALIDKAFAEHPIRRILAETSAIHTASRRVMEKSGLVLVREFDAGYPPISPEDVHGDVEYAIDRAAWQRARMTGGSTPA